MKAAVLTQFKHIEWKDVPEPSFGDSDVLIKVSYASICGSDQHVFNGEFGPRVTLPTIQGHEFVGTIADTFRKYPDIGILLPAMGYGDQQVKDLEATINATPCDSVIIGTPIDLRRVCNIQKPSTRVMYDLKEIGEPTLVEVLKDI